MTDKKISIPYLLAAALVVLLTWLIHEFAHWLTSEFFGYETRMTLNKTGAIQGPSPTEAHHLIISAAGPIITLVQAVIAFFLLKNRSWNKYVYLILFTAFYMRFLAGLMNLINLNDEGRISSSLGIGTYTLPIIVSGFLFYLVYTASKKHGLRWPFQLATTLAIMVFSSALILLDQAYGVRIL